MVRSGGGACICLRAISSFQFCRDCWPTANDDNGSTSVNRLPGKIRHGNGKVESPWWPQNVWCSSLVIYHSWTLEFITLFMMIPKLSCHLWRHSKAMKISNTLALFSCFDTSAFLWINCTGFKSVLIAKTNTFYQPKI